MRTIQIHDKSFDIYLDTEKLDKGIRDIGEQINKEYKDKDPLFVGVLNGSFRFAADLMKYIDLPSEITFVKIASYEGTSSTGKVKDLLGLTTSIENRHVIVLEDIVDTGHTWNYLHKLFSDQKPASLKIASLLFKPEPYQSTLPVDFVGFEIPNLFVVGYGLDFDGQGRNLNDIYQIKS